MFPFVNLKYATQIILVYLMVTKVNLASSSLDDDGEFIVL